MAERNDNIRLLEEMYKNAKMGCENINGVLPKVSDRFMIGELTDQFEHYGNYVGRVSELMHQRSAQPKEPGVMAKLGAKTGIVVNTMIDSTSSHVADMVAKGTRMDSGANSGAMPERVRRACDRTVPRNDRLGKNCGRQNEKLYKGLTLQ